MSGVLIEVDENGNITSEAKVIIDDGIATTLCKDGKYIFNWDATTR